MNIFYFTNNKKLNARLLDDKRLVKMVLETTQLLSNALYLNNKKSPYKPTHLKHPCTIWAAKSKANWNWLKEYGLELSKEYTRRYNKIHKCENVIRMMECNIIENPNLIQGLNIFDNNNKYLNSNNNIFEQPPQCMPQQYKCNKTTTAYIKYYIGEKFNLEYFKHTSERVVKFWERTKKFSNKIEY